ncbi:signal peptidase I [Paludibacter sp.]
MTQFPSLKNRLSQPPKQWIKAAIWCIVYILFIVWVGNPWWLFLLPIVFDAFVTKFIPWTWWKKSKNKTFLAIMGWVDAIVFALVAVYFINTYLFQNYQIPTSSLEKTLLVGDFLFVSKASYGPRVPNTPLSFPLVQHTFPVINTKSFIENPQWEYKRLKEFAEIKRDDIVVFNFPTGDTVPVNKQNPDYYISCYYEGYNVLRTQTNQPSLDEIMTAGRQVIKSKKQEYGEIVYRPVDRRENYVKRCVGLPGDKFEIKNNQIIVNGTPQEAHAGIQYNYYIQTDGRYLSSDVITKLGVSMEDRSMLNPQYDSFLITYLGMDPSKPVYHFPLTSAMMEKAKKIQGIEKISIEPHEMGGDVFPLGGNKKWNRDNMGPIYIPKKGATLKLNAYNLPIYERIIRVYEHNTLVEKDGKFIINGEETEFYTFKMDYYWMMGDNRHNSADSRYWGFVPEDHIVGRPVLVWLSLDKDRGWFNGKIRFNRFFKDASR